MPQIEDPKKRAEALPAIYETEQRNLLEIVKGSMDPQKWETFALMALKVPGIMRCKPDSIMRALLTNARLALPLDGVHAVLVPFGDECTHITGYMGWVAQYVRYANVTHVDMDIAYEGEHFKVFGGTDARIEHEKKPGINRTDPGKVVAAYAVAHLRGGGTKPWVSWVDELKKLAAEQIARARKRSNKPSPWETSTIEMYRKTPVIRLRKGLNMLDVPPEVRKAMLEAEVDDLGDPSIDVEGHIVAEAGSIDELVAARKSKAKSQESEASTEREPETSHDSERSESQDGDEIRDLYGIPVTVEWDAVKDEAFGGGNKVLAKLTPEKLVELLKSKDKDVTEAARAVLKVGQDLYAEGKTPQKAYQALALSFKQSETTAGF